MEFLKMNLVFTMAGRSSRFFNTGYTLPKYLLKIDNETMLSKVMNSFDLKSFQTITFICLKKHLHKYRLHEIINKLTKPHPNINIFAIDEITSGQAETAHVFLKNNYLENIVIFNVDSFYSEKQNLNEQFSSDCSGSIQVFESIIGEKYSYVMPSSGKTGLDKLVRVTEKVKISNFGSTGLYLFKNSNIFCEGFNKLFCKVTEGSVVESYVSLIYQELIESGHLISGFMVNKNIFHVVGTPEEYTSYCGQGS
jgi:NDP-sugar pyrophosphorylase family protein